MPLLAGLDPEEELLLPELPDEEEDEEEEEEEGEYDLLVEPDELLSLLLNILFNVLPSLLPWLLLLL